MISSEEFEEKMKDAHGGFGAALVYFSEQIQEFIQELDRLELIESREAEIIKVLFDA